MEAPRRRPLATVKIPSDLETVLNDAWEVARKVPGHLGENEARFLGLLAACVPGRGTIVEIGSFKGRSTVMLGKVASHYGLGPLVAIDPHNSPFLLDHQNNHDASSYKDFLASLPPADGSDHPYPRLSYSPAAASSVLP